MSKKYPETAPGAKNKDVESSIASEGGKFVKSSSKARQIVFTSRSSELLKDLASATKLNNSQAVATALSIAHLVLEAQSKGQEIVIEDSDENKRTNIRIITC